MNAKIMVVRISWNLSLGTKFHFNVNSSKKKIYCIDHQHNTWLQTENTQKNARFVNYFLSVAFRVVMPFRNGCHMLFHSNL